MYEVKVTGLTCLSCAKSIKFVLQVVDPNVEISVNVKNQTILVQTDKDLSQITALIEEAGYPVQSSKKV